MVLRAVHRPAAGLARGKQRRGIVLAAEFVGRHEDANRLRQHPAIGPEPRAATGRPPDRGAGFDRIDTAETTSPTVELGPIAIVDELDVDGRIEAS